MWGGWGVAGGALLLLLRRASFSLHVLVFGRRSAGDRAASHVFFVSEAPTRLQQVNERIKPPPPPVAACVYLRQTPALFFFFLPMSHWWLFADVLEEKSRRRLQDQTHSAVVSVP